MITKLLATIGGMISPAQKKEAGQKLIESIYDWSEFPLNPENGEVQQGLLCYETGSIPINAIVFFDAENRIVRFERIQKAESIVDNLLNSF